MLALRPMAISGRTSRPSLFGSSVQQRRGFVLGADVTPSDWYRRAKEALAKYDDLSSRVMRLPVQDARKKIQDWLGAPYADGTPANHMQAVLTDIREEVESFIPANVNAYEVPARTQRIQDFEDMNKAFEGMVVSAEAEHGSLPATHDVVQVQQPNPGPNWLMPVVIVAGALGIATLVTYAYGGKA